ncbi:MAG: CBS domain-containing protein [Blastocatellia bacterium]
MKVREVMTANPSCCVSSETAQRAGIIMRDEDTGVVPIVTGKESRKLVGMITDRDLCLGIVAGGLNPTNTTLETFMTSRVVSCNSDDDLDTVLKLMEKNQVRRIPVVDEQNIIQGIVSMADLMNRGKVSSGETREVLKSVSEPTGEASKPRADSAVSQAK